MAADNKERSLANLKPYQPGQSGNPGGKSKEREAARIACRNYQADRCLEHLKAIDDLAFNSPSDKVRAQLHTWWVEQWLGKAVVAVSGPNGAPLEVNASELQSRLASILDRAASKR